MECTRNSFRFRLLTVTDELLKAARSYLRSISENKFLRVKGPYGTRVGGQIYEQPCILDVNQAFWMMTRYIILGGQQEIQDTNQVS